jgi:hypothetical protein
MDFTRSTHQASRTILERFTIHPVMFALLSALVGAQRKAQSGAKQGQEMPHFPVAAQIKAILSSPVLPEVVTKLARTGPEPSELFAVTVHRYLVPGARPVKTAVLSLVSTTALPHCIVKDVTAVHPS